MDIKAELDAFQAQFFGPDRGQSLGRLGEIVNHASESVDARNAAMREIVARVDHEHVGLAAYLALAGGALVEQGEPPGPLGRALVAPLERALVNGARMHDHVAHLPDADEEDEDEDEDDEEAEHDHNGHHHDHDEDPDENGATIGRKWVTREVLDEIADKDVAAVQAWFSLEMWYRPAVATWTRDTAALRDVQRNETLRHAIATLGGSTETSYWLSLLIETLFEARIVVLLPELSEAWSVVADGVVDMGQLSVLLSEALAEPLGTLGASGVADAQVLAVMRGDGPQQTDDAYGCSFHLYQAEAVDDKGMPRDGAFQWEAPGGTGTHSLPPDFLPGTIQVSDGARVLVLVGPNAPGMRFTRVIPAVRTFEALAARLVAPTRLPVDQAKRWAELARSRAA